MKQKQILSCNHPIFGRRIYLQRLNADHVDIITGSFSNDRFWNAYRANQPRQFPRDELARQLQFEYERVPAQVGKIEWLISIQPMQLGNDYIDDVLPIGLASLSAIDTAEMSAEFMVGLFDSVYRKFGIGLEATLLVLDYAFNREDLRKLNSYVYAYNTSAQKNTLALGFKNEAFLKSYFRTTTNSSAEDVFKNVLSVEIFRKSSRLARLSNRLLGLDITLVDNRSNIESNDILASFILTK